MMHHQLVLICMFFSFFCPCHVDYLPTYIHVVWEAHHTHDSLSTVQNSFITVIIFIKFYLCTVHNGLMLCQTTNLLNFDTVMMNIWDEYLRMELHRLMLFILEAIANWIHTGILHVNCDNWYICQALLPLVFITNVCVIFNCIQVLISNVPHTHLLILVLKILL